MIIEYLSKFGRENLLEHEVKALIKDMGLSVPEGIFAKKGESLPNVKLGYPLVAKVSSAGIASKSDLGGVITGIVDESGLKTAVTALLSMPDAEGVLIEEEAKKGIEVIVGGTLDRQFGPVVMFGLGGIYVELYKDIAFALAPLDRDTAIWLIRQVKGHRLLLGYRGSPASDLWALSDAIIAVSEIIASGAVEEIDLNPVVVYPNGAIVLDAKLKKKGGTY